MSTVKRATELILLVMVLVKIFEGGEGGGWRVNDNMRNVIKAAFI